MRTPPRIVRWSLLLVPGLLAAPRLLCVAQDAPGMERQQSAERAVRGGDEKLSPELQRLSRGYAGTRGPRQSYDLDDVLLLRLYGISREDPEPVARVIVRLTGREELRALVAAGAEIRYRAGDLLYTAVPARQLRQLGLLDGVQSVDLVPTVSMPTPPVMAEPPQLLTSVVARGGATGKPAGAFDRQGLTGKGVVVAIVDSGIDWRHPDFIRPDGKSRILALWDTTDNSWATSRFGSRPPAMTGPGGKPLGTLYTQAQLNAALAGKGTVRARDRVGHGTACAGTAAGNGRGTGNRVPAGTYTGVAPAADLVVVNVSTTAPGSEGEISPYWLDGTLWAITYCRSLRRPCVVSQSFGNHITAKDGTHPSEQMLDRVAGRGKPGVVICTSAGNEARFSFHAAGRFGPAGAGVRDTFSKGIELFVTQPTVLCAYFNRGDDWGLAMRGEDRFFVDTRGRPVELRFFHRAGRLATEVWGSADARLGQPPDLQRYLQEAVDESRANTRTDVLFCSLPPGRYTLRGYGVSGRVKEGRFDLFLPVPPTASFGEGTEKEVLVGSPGNAAAVLTMGAYNFRTAWPNADGKETRYNLPFGALSDYSSPGFRRDGVVKPDLVAPATYTISTLAPNSWMARQLGRAHLTRDGRHVAWPGTSAAAPYAAGVAALMLEKNPTLDAAQVKAILKRTATKDRFTGAVPNPRWGYGKINPAAALKATPRARAAGRGKLVARAREEVSGR